MNTKWRPAAGCAPDTNGAAMAWREMIVVNKLAGLVQFFDVATHEKRGELKMPPLPHEVVLSPDRATAYVSIYGLGIFGRNTEHPGEEIAVIDVGTRRLVHTINVAPYKAPHGMAFDGHGVLWVSCDLSGMVLAVDTARRAVVDAIPTESFGTHWLTLTPDGAKLYCSNKTFPFAVVIDTGARRLAAKIPLPHGSEGLAMAPDGERVYVMAQRPHLLHVIDVATDTVIETIPVTVFGETPEGRNPQKRVQVSPDNRYLVISSFNTGEIAIAPVADPRDQRLIAVEKGPMGITFADTRVAYVMNHDHGSISIVDIEAGAVVGRFETAPGPETMALLA